MDFSKYFEYQYKEKCSGYTIFLECVLKKDIVAIKEKVVNYKNSYELITLEKKTYFTQIMYENGKLVFDNSVTLKGEGKNPDDVFETDIEFLEGNKVYNCDEDDQETISEEETEEYKYQSEESSDEMETN